MNSPNSHIETFSVDDLASELGIGGIFRLPEQQHAHAAQLAERIVTEILSDLRDTAGLPLGMHLLTEREKLFRIFDTYRGMGRLPILLKESDLRAICCRHAGNLGTTEELLYDRIMDCIHLILYCDVLRNQGAIADMYRSIGGVSDFATLAVHSCLNQLSSAWGIRAQNMLDRIFPNIGLLEGFCTDLSRGYGEFEADSNDGKREYNRVAQEFFRGSSLPPERLLIDVISFTGEGRTAGNFVIHGKADVDSLSFFLCQPNSVAYVFLLEFFKSDECKYAWDEWIKRHIALLTSDTATRRTFCNVFQIDGEIFNGKVLSQACRNIPKWLNSSLTKVYQAYRKGHRRVNDVPKKTGAILAHTGSNGSAVAILMRDVGVSSPQAPEKKITEIDPPNLADSFVQSPGRQLQAIDLTGSGLPKGTKVSLRRQPPAKSGGTPGNIVIENIDGNNSVSELIGLNYRGDFVYTLVVTLPDSHHFQGGSNKIELPLEINVTEVTPTPEETKKIKKEAAEKENILPALSVNMFVRGGIGQQLQMLDFSGHLFPHGTTAELRWNIGDKVIDKITIDLENGLDEKRYYSVPPLLGRRMSGKTFRYTLTVSGPTGRLFPDGRGTHRIWHDIADVQIPPTLEEIAQDKREKTARNEESRQRVEEMVQIWPAIAEILLSTLQPKKTDEPLPEDLSELSLMCVVDSLATPSQYSVISDEKGVISVAISQESSLYADILPEHRVWTIQPDAENTIRPEPSEEVRAALMVIVHPIGESIAKREDEKRAAAESSKTDAEFAALWPAFEPLNTFIREQRLPDTHAGQSFETAKATLQKGLDSLGWAMPWRLESNMFFRHKVTEHKITYGIGEISVRDKQNKKLTNSAEERCYLAIAASFRHLAEFYTADVGGKKTMIATQKKYEREMATAGEAYHKHMQKGEGRLVEYDIGDNNQGPWRSGFPESDKPQVIGETVSYHTVGDILAKHPGAKLLLKRDTVVINGEQSEGSPISVSRDNIMENLRQLRASPRGRHILKKRILITFDLVKFSHQDRRDPIGGGHVAVKKPGAVTALDLLVELVVRIEKVISSQGSLNTILSEGQMTSNRGTSIDTEFISNIIIPNYGLSRLAPIGDRVEINDAFLDAYIDLLERHEIRVHYVWPLSRTLEEHLDFVAILEKEKE